MVKKSAKKTTRVSRRPVLIILGLSLLLTLGFVSYRMLYPPAPVKIFSITPIPLEYGDTTITGVLRKDSPVGKVGQYTLILKDTRAIFLDVKNIDSLLGSQVYVQGLLIPPEGKTPGFMKVNKITLEPNQ